MKNKFRQGALQALVSDEIFKAFAGQVGIIAIILGLQFKSWYLFGALFIAPCFIFMYHKKHKIFEIIALILCIAYTFCWAFVGYQIGSLFDISASIVLSIIGLLCGVGVNRGALQYYKDIL
jgi:hypothetical protein